MEDWAAFVSTSAHGDEADLERDAEALIERLEAFGSKVSSMELSPAREEKSAAKTISCYVPKVTPPDRRCSPSPHSVASDARRCSIETSSCGGSSVASEERRVDGQLVSKRLYAHAKARQERAALDKENADRLAASSAAPHINARSKAMQRSGSIGERLHQEAHSKVLRQEAVAAETKRREAESAKESDNDGHPAINEVSASMMRDRTGDVVDRLYAQAKTRGREQEQREAAAAQEILAHSRPEISTGSQRIAAKLPDRHVPVQERLYAEASARQSQLSAASQASSGESFQPHISAHSRRLAEKANQGVSLEERLSRPHSKKELGPSSELMECVHAPVVNSKSEQLVHQRLIRQGIDARTPVEDRLYAEANKRPAVVEEPEHIPTINPNSERILNRRGLVAPLEQRLQQGIRNARAGVSDEAEQCKYQPALSKGSQKLLANKERLPVQQRLLEWGAKHTRAEGNPDLEDARFRFGPPKGSESPSMIPSPRERPSSDGSGTPRTAGAPKQRTQPATKPTVAGEPKTPARSDPDRLPHGGVSTPHGSVNTPRSTSMGSGYGSRVIGSSKAVRSKSDKPVPGKSTPDISSRSREMPVTVGHQSQGRDLEVNCWSPSHEELNIDRDVHSSRGEAGLPAPSALQIPDDLATSPINSPGFGAPRAFQGGKDVDEASGWTTDSRRVTFDHSDRSTHRAASGKSRLPLPGSPVLKQMLAPPSPGRMTTKQAKCWGEEFPVANATAAPIIQEHSHADSRPASARASSKRPPAGPGPNSAHSSRPNGGARSPAVPFTAKRPKQQPARQTEKHISESLCPDYAEDGNDSTANPVQTCSKIPIASPARRHPFGAHSSLSGRVSGVDVSGRGPLNQTSNFRASSMNGGDATTRVHEQLQKATEPYDCESDSEQTIESQRGDCNVGSDGFEDDCFKDESFTLDGEKGDTQAHCGGMDRSPPSLASSSEVKSIMKASSYSSSQKSGKKISCVVEQRAGKGEAPRRLYDLLEDAQDVLGSPSPSKPTGMPKHESGDGYPELEHITDGSALSPEVANRLHEQLSLWTHQFEQQQVQPQSVVARNAKAKDKESKNAWDGGKESCTDKPSPPKNQRIESETNRRLSADDEEHEQALKEARAEIAALRRRCERRDAEIERAEAELETIRRRCDKVETDAEGQCKELQRRLDESEVALAEARSQVNELLLQSEKGARAAAADATVRVEKELAALQKKSQDVEEALSKARNSEKEARADAENARQEKARLLKECLHLREVRASAATKFSDERARLESQLHNALEELALANRQREEEKMHVQAQLQERDSEHEEHLTQLIRKMEQEHSHQLQRADRLAQDQKRAHALEIQELIRGRDDAEKMVERLERKLEARDGGIVTAQRQEEERRENERREAARRVLEARREEMRREAAQRESEEAMLGGANYGSSRLRVNSEYSYGHADNNGKDFEEHTNDDIYDGSRRAGNGRRSLHEDLKSTSTTPEKSTTKSQPQLEVERLREELRRSQEDQLGAALRARRKEKELRAMRGQI